MNANVAIQVEELKKIYKLYNKPIDRLKESLHPLGKKFHRDFHAVNNISFSINKGETLGIVGKNGSGKSTLLKMITGVLNPTAGKINVNGKISALLELGAGFNTEYTGLENIYLNGTIMGFSKEEMDLRLDEILSFADIGDFIYQPVKIYSSGMFVRLAFAVAINVDPEILIIDEALSVGDMRFQQKCFRKIDEFKDSKTILFVSHDLSVINKYCNRALWINEGELLADGTPKEISKKYQAYMIGSSLNKFEDRTTSSSQLNNNNLNNKHIDSLNENLDVLGDNLARIVGISLLDGLTNEKTTIVEPRQVVKICIKVEARANIQTPIVGFTLKDRLGNKITAANSFILEEQINTMEPGNEYSFCFQFKVPFINQGQYTISPAVASGSQEEHIQHCWVHDALIIQVLPIQKNQLDNLIIIDDVKFYSID